MIMKFSKHPDVYLNFRGGEMRKTFGSHLVSSFKTKHITNFIAAETFEDVDGEALEQSRVAIPVISSEYFNSDVWVGDLRKIIECERIGTLTAIPVFFNVNLLDILNHAAAKYADAQNETLEMVRKWLFTKVDGNSSFNSNDWEDDSELVDKITSFVSDILTSSPSSYHSTGLSSLLNIESLKTEMLNRESWNMERFRLNIGSLLNFFKDAISTENTEDLFWRPSSLISKDLRQNVFYNHLEEMRNIMSRPDSTIIGIWGNEGFGKTTLGRNLYEEFSPRFQHSRYTYPATDLIPDMLNSEDFFKESNFRESTDNAIKEMMGHRKVLLVADNVNDIKQLKGIIKDASWFGPGSRVIVITQDRSLLTECRVKHIYEVECPRYEEALAFFSEFAFKQSKPLFGFEGLSSRAVHVANRLPLALKVLGSFLHHREKDEWESTLHRLEASRDEYASEVNRYIGADDYAPRRPIKVDRHIGVDEANSFRSYCLAFE